MTNSLVTRQTAYEAMTAAAIRAERAAGRYLVAVIETAGDLPAAVDCVRREMRASDYDMTVWATDAAKRGPRPLAVIRAMYRTLHGEG